MCCYFFIFETKLIFTLDCEDFGKIIIRLFLALRRIRLHSVELENHPLLKKVAEFLACFVPFLVLYGVSSAQINEAPSDIKKMGAHENAVLTPLHQVITEIARFDEGIYKWVKEVKEVEPNIEEYIEKSKHYQSLILEVCLLHPFHFFQLFCHLFYVLLAFQGSLGTFAQSSLLCILY